MTNDKFPGASRKFVIGHWLFVIDHFELRA